MKLGRRHFTFLGLTSLASVAAGRVGLRYPNALLASALNSDCTIIVPASSMKERVDAFRTSFVKSYLLPSPNPPYPIYEAMIRSNALPSTANAIRALGERNYLNIRRPHPSTPGNPRSFRLLNQGSLALDAPFFALMNDQNLRLTVNFPKKFEISGLYDDTSLTFNLVSSLLLTLVDLPNGPDGNPVNIEKRQVLTSLKVSDTGIDYNFRSFSTPTNKVTIKIDFRPDAKFEVQCSNRTRARALWNALAMVPLMLAALFLFGACTTRVHDGPKQVCPLQSELTHVTRCCEQDKKGMLNEGGILYLRIRHETVHGDQCVNQQDVENLCTYVRADPLPTNCVLKVCAMVEEFPLSYLESNPKREVDGCDFRYIQNDPAAFNVKYVTKCQDMKVVPTSLTVNSNVQFQQQLTVAGGAGPQFHLATTAPPWVTLTNSGVLRGTPPAGAAEHQFVVAVITDNACKGGVVFNLTVQ